MNVSEDNFSMKWDKVNLKINGKVVEYPLLRIKIAGDPPLSKFIGFMSEVESFTEDFEKDYISITDFTDLYPNKIIERLISISSNNYIRSITFVSNQSKISFVLLGKDSKLSVLKKQLKNVNSTMEKKSYKYNYHFIEDESEMVSIAEGFFSKI